LICIGLVGSLFKARSKLGVEHLVLISLLAMGPLIVLVALKWPLAVAAPRFDNRAHAWRGCCAVRPEIFNKTKIFLVAKI
jgi:hypothetical protein